MTVDRLKGMLVVMDMSQNYLTVTAATTKILSH